MWGLDSSEVGFWEDFDGSEGGVFGRVRVPREKKKPNRAEARYACQMEQPGQTLFKTQVKPRDNLFRFRKPEIL